MLWVGVTFPNVFVVLVGAICGSTYIGTVPALYK